MSSGEKKKRATTFLIAVIASIVVAVIVNRIGVAWIAGSLPIPPETLDESGWAFHDGSAMLLTLASPAFVAGAVAGLIARQDGYYAAVASFILWCAVGAFWSFWAIPIVGPISGENRLLHYFMYNPLPTLPFGAFGGWIGGQFSSGKFSLNDAEPVVVPGSDE